MSKNKPNSGSRRELINEVQRLAARVRTLQDSGGPGHEASEGLAEGIASALGRMVPGLGKLIEMASQSPDYQKKLADIDEAVKRKFKEQPLGRASAGLSAIAPRRQMGIPPSVRRTSAGRGPQAGNSQSKPSRRGGYRPPAPPKVHLSPQTPAQLPVDVFDEGKTIVVLAETPGLGLEDISVSLDGTVLVINIHAPHRDGVQRIELPCEVAGQPKVSLTNGVLNVQLRKANNQ